MVRRLEGALEGLGWALPETPLVFGGEAPEVCEAALQGDASHRSVQRRLQQSCPNNTHAHVAEELHRRVRAIAPERAVDGMYAMADERVYPPLYYEPESDKQTIVTSQPQADSLQHDDVANSTRSLPVTQLPLPATRSD